MGSLEFTPINGI